MQNEKNLLKDEGMHAGAQADKFAFASVLRKTQTPQEQKLWSFLRTRPKGLKLRRQHPFKDYILDLYCHGAMLVIELDGMQHRSNTAYDDDRTKVIENYGLKVIRFDNSEIDHSFEKVIRRILTLL